ncbi:MAG: hypothetical protein Q9211_000386 [Gyalolechia sp. 1 TL-2023]
MTQPPTEGSCPPTLVDSARDDPERLYAKVEAARAGNPVLYDASELGTSDVPAGQDLPQPSEEVQDILRMIPLNTEAHRAFNSVAQSAKVGSLDLLHAQYLRVTGKRPLRPHLEDAGNGSGETTDEAPNDPPTMVHAGYYRVHFALPAVSKGPTWVIGRGSGQRFGPTRNVDILLVAPGTKGFPGLAAAHIYLGIHPDSGAWRIVAGAKVTVEDEIFKPGEAAYLCRPKTRIEILNMQYLIRFELTTPNAEREYIQERNTTLLREGFALPHTTISGIPIQGDTVFDSIVFRHGIGSGSFGSVYEGFSPGNGELRVAKRIIVKSAREVPAVNREIRALEQFKGCIGIIQLIDWRTALNGKELLVSQYPLDVYLIHDKGIAFDQYDWITVSWDLKRSLCYQLLVGLTEIHGAGCMHRDITPMNILIFPHRDIPQATLCDFGKFCQSPTDVDTRLAGWKFLPPELQEGEKNPYTQILDIWMLGLALTYCWWPQTKILHPRQIADYRHMQKLLRHERTSDMLGDLIADMMAWNPHERPSAVDALEHKSLQRCTAKGGQDTGPTMKRPYDASD